MLALGLGAGWVPIAPAQAQKAQGCRPETFATGRVVAVKDGSTMVLGDAREVILAGIVAPRPDRPAGVAAAAALTALVLDRDVVLKRATTEIDRYGRVLAHVFVTGGSRAASIQNQLLAAGHAQVSGRAMDRACTLESLVFERRARDGKLGLWADPYYDLKRTEQVAEILAQRGRFAVVEGTVLSVRESGGTIYVNFGRRWSEDFTATIPKRVERAFAAAGLQPKQFERRRVRVRGWIEARGGPWIEATRPEQIEIAERKR